LKLDFVATKITVDVKVTRNNPIRFKSIPFPGNSENEFPKLKMPSSVNPIRAVAVAIARKNIPKKT